MTERQRIPLDDVAQVVTKLTENNVKRAITLMMYTSGLSFAKIIQLKQSDLITACKNYIDEEDIESLIKRNPIEENIIPMWRFCDGDTIRLVFSSSQSLYFIFQHLSERQHDSEYLFINKNGKQLTSKYITNWLNPKFRSTITVTNDKGNDDFTGKGLSNSFTQLCKSCRPEHINSDMIIKLFEGSTAKKAKEFCKKMLEDNTVILEYYEKLLPSLTVDLTDYDTTSQGISGLNSSEESNAESESSHNEYSNSEIRQILKDYYKECIQIGSQIDYDEYNFLIQYTYDIAVKENDSTYTNFINSKTYLDKLFKRAKIKWAFNQYSEPIYIDIHNKLDEDTINKILKVLYDVGIHDVIPIDEKQFLDCLDVVVNHQFEYANSVVVSSYELEQALTIYIDN